MSPNNSLKGGAAVHSIARLIFFQVWIDNNCFIIRSIDNPPTFHIFISIAPRFRQIILGHSFSNMSRRTLKCRNRRARSTGRCWAMSADALLSWACQILIANTQSTILTFTFPLVTLSKPSAFSTCGCEISSRPRAIAEVLYLCVQTVHINWYFAMLVLLQVSTGCN